MSIINKCDYVIIASGYTGRLVSQMDDLKNNLVDTDAFESPEDCDKCNKKEFKTHDKYGKKIIHNEEESIECDCVNSQIMFIHDTIWGNGLYKFSENTEKIQELLKIAKNERGTICFKCPNLSKAMCISAVLMEMHYCACFCFENLYELKLTTSESGDKVLIMYFDCESG